MKEEDPEIIEKVDKCRPREKKNKKEEEARANIIDVKLPVPPMA